MKRLYVILFLFCTMFAYAQNSDIDVLGFDEYLGMVKAYHPVVKQAQLTIEKGQAELLRSRGAFDPKLEVDYDRKKFKGTEYYDKLNASFKIPTWYGIELKANFEEATGDFLNPESTLPDDGLYSAGVSFSVLQGLLINDRMAALKQARLFANQTEADRDIMVNTVLYKASLAYFNWLQAYNEKQIYADFLVNAELRFNGIKQSVEVGDRAAIDSVEARIVMNDRKLNLEKANVRLMKSKLELSNFLWISNSVPVELQDQIIPDIDSRYYIDTTLGITAIQTDSLSIEDHPKIQSLNFKYESLEVNKRLKANKLLPQVDLQYNFLSETPDQINSFNTANYKSGLSVRFPLFLRKERGELKLSQIKLNDTRLELTSTRLQLSNKIEALKQQLVSFVRQEELLNTIVSDYTELLQAEDRKFELGESSIFLVNSRETKLIEAQLKAVELQNTIFSTKAKFFNTLAINPSL